MEIISVFMSNIYKNEGFYFRPGQPTTHIIQLKSMKKPILVYSLLRSDKVMFLLYKAYCTWKMCIWHNGYKVNILNKPLQFRQTVQGQGQGSYNKETYEKL